MHPQVFVSTNPFEHTGNDFIIPRRFELEIIQNCKLSTFYFSLGKPINVTEVTGPTHHCF